MHEFVLFTNKLWVVPSIPLYTGVWSLFFVNMNFVSWRSWLCSSPTFTTSQTLENSLPLRVYYLSILIGTIISTNNSRTHLKVHLKTRLCTTSQLFSHFHHFFPLCTCSFFITINHRSEKLLVEKRSKIALCMHYNFYVWPFSLPYSRYAMPFTTTTVSPVIIPNLNLLHGISPPAFHLTHFAPKKPGYAEDSEAIVFLTT